MGSQHELFWKEKREKVVLGEGKASLTLQDHGMAHLRTRCSSIPDNAILQKNK